MTLLRLPSLKLRRDYGRVMPPKPNCENYENNKMNKQKDGGEGA